MDIKMRMLLTYCFMASFICFSLRAAEGGFFFNIQNVNINAGGTGTVDVFVTGAIGDTLGRFGYEFNITGATAQSGELRFVASQSKSEQSVVSPSPYVFLGDTDPGNLLTVRGNGGLDPLSLVGADVLNSLDSVSANGTFLLARLELEHLGPSVGINNFTISLNLGSAFTEFDSDFDIGTANSYSAGELSATSGIVTVSAVPEPSSLALIVIGGVCTAIRVRRRARQCSGLNR
jgi:hypothetical protein